MTDETPPARLADDRLEQLGLARQPFADGDLLYTDDDRDTRLNIAIGVLQSTPAMVLIAGGPGIGKSCFLRQLAEMDEGMVFAGVAATESMRLPEILQGIGARGGETVVAAASRSVRETEGRLVLVVDDAERLPQQTVVQLAGLQAKLAERDQELPIVLACDRGHAAQLAEALEPSLAERSPLHEVALGPFGPAGTRAYLRFRIAQAGGDASLILDDRTMERIHARSEGVPARINAEAVRALSQPARRPLGGLALPAGAGRLAVIIGAPLIVTAAVAGWFLTGDEPGDRVVRNDDAPLPAEQDTRVESGTAAPFNDETEAGGSSGTVASAGGANGGQGAAPIQRETAAATAGAEAVAAAPENGNEGADTATDAAGAGTGLAADAAPSQAPSPDRVDEAAPPADGRTTTNDVADDTPAVDVDSNSTADTVDTATDTAADAAAESDGTVAAEAAERTAQAEPDPGSETRTSGEIEDETAPADTAEPASPEPADESVSGGWLAGREGDHYTVQLLGAYETTTVERFLGQIDGETGRVHRVVTERDGRDWYVLVTGDYATVEAAREAVEELPPEWTENGAFPRSFNSLKP